MATTKSEIKIEEQSIIIKKEVVDQSLITIADDHTFTLKPGIYTFHVQIGAGEVFNVRTRLIDVTQPKNPINVEYSTTNRLIGDIHTDGKQKYMLQHWNNRLWQPLQTLPAANYTATITFIKPLTDD